MRIHPQSERTVATVGLSGHGKTVFLASLFWDSFFSLSQSLYCKDEPFSVRAVSARADEVFYANAQILERLTVPPANPRVKTEPAILEFSGIPHAHPRWWRGRSRIRLAFYDIAGEVFARDELAREYAPFLRQADDVIFVFDPTQPDFSALTAARLVDLIHRVSAGGRRKHLIIALSKMDELREIDEWQNMVGMLWPDAVPEAGDLESYFKQMAFLSSSLRFWWTDPERQAQNFLSSLPPETRFCAISALGRRPTRTEDGRLQLPDKPAPFRVRDPLFWIFRAAGVM